MSIWKKIYNRWTKLRLQPIRVYCLHEICAKPEFPNETADDWIDIDAFKRTIIYMRQQGYVFISLSDAYQKISTDIFRRKKNAVLTIDDCRQSLREIMPWLIEQKLPITLFVNGNYMDGKEHNVVGFNPFHCLTQAELNLYIKVSNGLISIQSHGYEHLDVTQMTEEEFKRQVEKNMDYISVYQKQGVEYSTSNTKLHFYAYTWGHHNAQTDAILKELNIIPVLTDGRKNDNDISCIHRERFISI